MTSPFGICRKRSMVMLDLLLWLNSIGFLTDDLYFTPGLRGFEARQVQVCWTTEDRGQQKLVCCRHNKANSGLHTTEEGCYTPSIKAIYIALAPPSCPITAAPLPVPQVRSGGCIYLGTNDNICCLYRGFTSFDRSDYLQWKKEGRLQNDGVNAKLLGNHGPLDTRRTEHLFETAPRDCHVPIHAE